MSARLGFIMLVHTALHRAAQVARYVAEAGSPHAPGYGGEG